MIFWINESDTISHAIAIRIAEVDPDCAEKKAFASFVIGNGAFVKFTLKF